MRSTFSFTATKRTTRQSPSIPHHYYIHYTVDGQRVSVLEYCTRKQANEIKREWTQRYNVVVYITRA